MSKRFKSLSELPVELQREAIREGETRLLAQLSVASDADKRALTWSGFLLAGATALLGSGFGFAGMTGASGEFAIGALIWGAMLLFSAFLSLQTVKPMEFNLPGNRPGNWLPEEWDCCGSDMHKVQTAIQDQARHLDRMIRENADYAKRNGELMNWSFRVAFFSVFAAAIVLLLYTVAPTP